MTAEIHSLMRPNPEVMMRHLDHLFGGYLDGYHDGLIELAWTQSHPDAGGRYKLTHAQLFGTDQFEELIDLACQVNQIPMTNVYIGAALRKPGTQQGQRTKDSDFYALISAYADLDDEDANNNAKFRFASAKPTLVVCTGKHPHWRHQPWWRLAEPVTDPVRASAMIKGLAVHMSGDGSVANPGRVMRLAGGIAWDQKPGRIPEVTGITHLREPGPGAYLPEHIEHIYQPLYDIQTAREHRSAPGPNVGIVREKNGLGLDSGKVTDGREKYMRNLVCARLIDYIGRFGAAPSAEELFDDSWHVYEQTADLSRPGRGKHEFMDKCRYTVGRFLRGEIRGAETLDKAVAVYRLKKEARQDSTRHETFPADPDRPTDPDKDDEPICVGGLTGSPAERGWVVEQWIPKGVITALYGDGGVGKTLLAQQLIYAAGVGGEWLGLDVPKLRGLGVFCEDDRDELHRRHDAIKTSMGLAIGNPFTETWIWPRVGSENILVTFDRNNQPILAPFFQQVAKHIVDKQIELLVLDTVADLFGGNEIIRAQVNYFIKSTCGSLIKEMKEHGVELTIILLAHPSQAGRNSGSGESGSTAWNNAVRSRLYLTRPEDGGPNDRILTRKKSNYAASGDETALPLQWHEGVIVPVSGTNSNSMAWPDKKVCTDILRTIDRAWKAGSPWSSDPRTRKDGRFAPLLIADSFPVKPQLAVQMMETWLMRGFLSVEIVDSHSKRKGIKVLQYPD
jgi:hypothetical protein